MIQHIASPINGLQSDGIETIGIEQCGLVVIAKNRQVGFVDDQVQAFARVRSVADDIAQANNSIDLLSRDVSKHCSQCFEIAVDVANQTPGAL